MSEVEKEKEVIDGDSFSDEFEILNKLGLHARAAALFVNTAGNFESEITIIKDGVEVNGKSIMSILTLGATCGSLIKVVANGPDAEKAVKELGKLISNKFGED
jgi:phosphocarrier protein HPr